MEREGVVVGEAGEEGGEGSGKGGEGGQRLAGVLGGGRGVGGRG